MSLLHWLRDRPRYELIESGVARVDRILACSEWVRRELMLNGIASECVHLPVPSPGVGYHRERSVTPRLFYCGRLDIEKGVDRLIEAFARARADSPEAVLRLAGRGPERKKLESLTHELGIDHRVVFLGWLDPADVERELAAAWALVAPSLWAEPLGLVALEAIVRGVPVVASKSGGFAETVEEGVSGTLIPNGDVDALAATLSEIVAGRRYVNGVPDQAARAMGERHDVAAHIERMRRIFNETIAAAR